MRAILFAAALAAAASPALAQDGGRRGLSFGGRGAYHDPADGEAAWYGGAQLRLHLSDVWALEGSADYRRVRLGPDRSTRLDVYPVQASLLAYIIPRGPISPFIFGGFGWYFTRTKGPGGFDETESRTGPHAGAGLQVFLNEKWSIDGTWRYVWLQDVRTRDASLLDRELRERGSQFTGALNFHF